jgi:Flp pilus assembly protein TadB
MTKSRIWKRSKTDSNEFHSITEAGSALSDDLPSRQRRYFISMMIRTACFLLAVFTPSPYRWFFLIGAITLPYISVIVANGGRETISGQAKMLRSRRKEIE